MSENPPPPDLYKSPLSAESQTVRDQTYSSLVQSYADLSNLSGVKRLKLQRDIDLIEESLAWQGANPKDIDFADLKSHVQHPHHEDPVDNKYQARIKNRATAIRAYCVQCQGGMPIGVRECPSITCPLFPFRMGSDPLRGYELPKPAPILDDIEDDTPDNLFEEGDDGEEADAIE